MKKTDVQWLARACGGRIFGNQHAWISGVAIDSREVGPGEMFVAYVGPSKDGHDFLEGALERGCRVFLVSKEDRIPPLLTREPSASFILTGDTEQGLTGIAGSYLDQFDLHRVAVTGSVGKTTTKEMIARVLSRKYRTVSTSGNLNTTLGQCLTAFRAEPETQAIVFEMGMDRKGELESYCRWVRPKVAVITNVGTAHLERLGTREAIAEAKLEIAAYLGARDVLVFNSDSDFLAPADVAGRLGGRCRLCPVGTGRGAEYYLRDVHGQDGGAAFVLEDLAGRRSQDFMIPIPGLHNAMNAALAAAAGSFLDIALQEAAAALGMMQSAERRLRVETAGGVTLIDDTYNAGPDSMRAALDVLAQTEGRRRIAVLADILELGSYLEEGHRSVGRYAAEKNTDVLIAIGSNAKYYAIGAEEAGYRGHLAHYDSNREAMDYLLAELRQGDVVLVKGSNATGVAAVAARIHEWINAGEES